MKTYGNQNLKLRVLPDGQLRFFYVVNQDLSCEFPLLCEVGQRFQARFRRLMASHGLRLADKPMVLESRPYLADTLATPASA
ncbi:MAG TPA: hypothetical protein VHS96_18400 [Bacteroidia bacterium]|nr:hypothetical protein [Bacteroidia bacterium]